MHRADGRGLHLTQAGVPPSGAKRRSAISGRLGLGCPLTFALSLCIALPAVAQTRAAGSGDPPPHISFVEGAATLEREGRVDPAVSSMPLLDGDRLRTEGGRAEVVLTDQSVLCLDQYTVVDLLSDSLFRLLRGRLRLTVSADREAERYRVDSTAGWVRIHEPGDYRVAVTIDGDRVDVELAVFHGFGELGGERASVTVSAGERSSIRGSGFPTLAQPFNSAAWDTFDRWSEERRDAQVYAGSLSSRYLPTPLRSYASTFDRYGTWRHNSAYGYVWYPASHASWRPYYNGRWTHGQHYGMDAGRVRPVDVADSSLWTLGLLSPRVVLGPGLGVGVLTAEGV